MKAHNKGVDCPGYKDSDALVVCVEGGRGSGGSHERIHNNYDIALQQKAENKKVDANGKMSLNEIIDVAAESHTETFPLSGCGKDCIKAQLEDYYNGLCPNAKVNAVDQNGNPINNNDDKKRRKD
nr:HNH/endonuclease VII fold toxin-2 domain-containing protein [Cellvibrio sp. pealriver]